jgi:hypothetical protein
MTKKDSRGSASRSRQKKKQGYTAGEWFMVALGLALVILIVGIIVTSVLGG